ncbi:MAG: 30S ribosomal protein S3 [Spirochaetes bacterium]|nr:30S ribosomal protein S3 [Spirochaetota bacterium]
MGQKVNPVGIRIGVTKNWDSVWYADKKGYKKALHEDIQIRKLINDYQFSPDKDKKVSPEISKIEILRKPDRVLVVVHSSRPGVIIGVDGKHIMDISSKINKIVSLKVEVKIKEIKQPEKDAQLIANNVARQLTNRMPFRRVMKKAIADAKKSGVGGIKIQCSGRLGGADMARTEWYREGRIPLHTLRADIDYGLSTAFTTYGTTGVKVWIFKREVLKREAKTDAGQLVKKSKKPAKEKTEK